jgi:aspartate aminotransferase/aminotransferase
MSSHWLSARTQLFDSSGIRKVFDLGAKLKDPINLSIGQPDFDVPETVRLSAIEAINSRKNGYALTQGVPELREKLAARVKAEFNHDDRELFVTSGTSGGLTLALLALVDPGDEVICFDPCFVLYDSLAALIGGKVAHIDTYPDFRVDLNRVESAVTPRTKAIIFNSPANPTGAMADEAVVRGLAELAQRKNVVLISDEIYREFSYERAPVSPAKFNPQTLVVDGFSKTYGMPGWRIGFAHGPAEIIREMLKLQQYTFVCAPHPLQCAAVTAMEIDMSSFIADYRRKRDMLIDGISDCYEVARPGGAFYAFPKTPWGTGQEFCTAAIERHSLLIIPGNVFSRRDTHFRVSYAAADGVIQRGVEALRKLAGKK